MSSDRQNLFNIARKCQIELAENDDQPLLKGSQPKQTKSTTNIKAFTQQLHHCQNQQIAVVDNIDRIKNNMERVRINYQADDYEDILISNIKAEQKDAKSCQDQRILECRDEVQG